MDRRFCQALCIGAGAVLLAGCGGLQPPIGTPATSEKALRAASSFQVLHKFGRHSNPLHDHGGALPKAGLVDVDGTLYGTTEAGGYRDNGTVYSISTTGKRKLLYNFRGQNYGDGSEPTDDLTTLHGTLYGTTIQGGTCNEGTVYSISTNGREHVLYTFCNTDYAKPTAGVVRVNDTFYGTNVSDDTWGGDVYSLSSQGVFNRLYVFRGPYYGDGTEPQGRLLNVNGTLYGTTHSGGTGCPNGGSSGGCGTVYSLTTSGREKVLYSFQGGSDGAGPTSGLIEVDGILYGTTMEGGSHQCYTYGCGTVYSITRDGKEKVLYRFKGAPSDGAFPYAALLNVNGMLYGTTTDGYGTVFSVTTGGREQVLHKFHGSDGAAPFADLVDANGILYGTTYNGGTAHGCVRNGCGTVFAISP